MIILPSNVAVIEGDTHHAEWCKTQGLVHDQWMADTLRHLVKRYKVTVAVDGGAHIGTLCRPLLDAGVRVHAFEVNPAAIECLRHNCAGAQVYEYALGDKEGFVAFHPSPNAGASHVELSEIETGVPMAPLDQFGIDPQLIKLDIEGFEYRALLGATETIERNRPVMIIEINQGALDRSGSKRDEVFQFLHGHGYVFQIMQPQCQWDSPQYDILASPL